MFRKAAFSDIDSVAKIYESLHDEEEKGVISTGWIRGVYPTRSTAAQALVRGDLFVCEENGIILGAGIINQIQVDVYAAAPWKYRAEDDQVCVLHTLVISPSDSRRGLGTEFVRFYESYARDYRRPVLRIGFILLHFQPLVKVQGYRRCIGSGDGYQKMEAVLQAL